MRCSITPLDNDGRRCTRTNSVQSHSDLHHLITHHRNVRPIVMYPSVRLTRWSAIVTASAADRSLAHLHVHKPLVALPWPPSHIPGDCAECAQHARSSHTCDQLRERLRTCADSPRSHVWLSVCGPERIRFARLRCVRRQRRRRQRTRSPEPWELNSSRRAATTQTIAPPIGVLHSFACAATQSGKRSLTICVEQFRMPRDHRTYVPKCGRWWRYGVGVCAEAEQCIDCACVSGEIAVISPGSSAPVSNGSLHFG